MISFVARYCLVLAAAAAWPESTAHSQEIVYDEHRVKAAFIYHFSTFVVWPDATQADRDFVIAVIGDDDVAR
ncbi:MAG TPA: YfiR/HmsC family protein, partial [Woeseiaceae bacterium]